VNRNSRRSEKNSQNHYFQALAHGVSKLAITSLEERRREPDILARIGRE